MKKFLSFSLPVPIIIGIFLYAQVNAQESISSQRNLGRKPLPEATVNENQAIENMKKDGVSAIDIEKWKMKRKLISLQEKNTTYPPIQLNQARGTCGDMGGEHGWSGWVAATGDYSLVGNSNYVSAITWNNLNATIAGPRFNLTSGGGNDACTPGLVAGSPAIPVVAPGFGAASIQLGQPVTNGSSGGCNRGCVERLTYTLNVTAADTNFIYAYAILFDYPGSGGGGGGGGGHTSAQVPFAEIYILDQKGDTVKCSHQKYMGDTLGQVNSQPGFYTDACTGGGGGGGGGGNGASYKPWTTVGVNLGGYIGQTLSVSIINADCTEGGHYCHSYWDFACPPLANSSTPFCVGQQTTMSAPASNLVSNQYTYQWYINTKPYNPKNHWTIIPNATGINYSVAPLPGDTFAVQVIQKSGCNFWIPFIPNPTAIIADFTLANKCGTVTFTDASPPPNTGTIASWNWSFPGGNPATSSVQNPVVTYTATGIHSVSLTITSSAGCTSTKVLTVTTGNPVANFSTGPVCLGEKTLFSDGSSAPTGDSLTTWAWNFGDGNTSGLQNPAHIYSTAGTFSVTLSITTKSGCTSTSTQTVTVNPIPVPAFLSSAVCFNTPTVFTDQSTGATQWLWNFGDGSTSTTQNPSHIYGTVGTFSVTLIVANAFGCKDTLTLPAVVNPFPKSSFSSTTVCFGNPTLFSDLSTISSGSITGWIWDFGDPNSGINNTSSLVSPSHVFTQPHSYNVILTVTSDKGCQSISTYPVTFNPPPVALFISTSVCLNTPTNFTSNSTSSGGDPITAWDWNYGDGSPHGSGAAPVHSYTAAGNYTVGLIVTTVGGCKDTVKNPVAVYGIPVANYSDSLKGCSPVCTTFKDLSLSPPGESIISWQWDCPGGTPSTSGDEAPSFCWNTPGTYDVQLIVTTNHGCKDTMITPQYIHVYSWPHADFCVAPLIAPSTDPVFNFCDQWTSNVTNWVWDFGDNSTLDTTHTNPVHSYSAVVTNNDFYKYTICVHVQTQHGCADHICKEVELLPEFTFYIPNTFTPNGDNINELFYGKSRGVKDYNIWVFDRWGNQIWDCHHTGKNTDWDITGQEGLSSFCRWDGKVVRGGLDMNGGSGQFSQEDVYVWKVELTDIFDKHHLYVGHVNIVK